MHTSLKKISFKNCLKLKNSFIIRDINELCKWLGPWGLSKSRTIFPAIKIESRIEYPLLSLYNQYTMKLGEPPQFSAFLEVYHKKVHHFTSNKYAYDKINRNKNSSIHTLLHIHWLLLDIACASRVQCSDGPGVETETIEAIEPYITMCPCILAGLSRCKLWTVFLEKQLFPLRKGIYCL